MQTKDYGRKIPHPAFSRKQTEECMHHCTETQAVCRGCGKLLDGSPYWKGGTAYDPVTRRSAKANHFGGWVCSESCDYRAHLEQESDMPGHGGQRLLDCNTRRRIEQKWA